MTGHRVSFWWTMGVNQSHQGVRTAQAIINLALMTGNIGRPGTGANSITGQCNAMGSRLFGNTTNLLGGREFTNAEDRAEVADLLGLDAARIPDRNSWAYNEILEGVTARKDPRLVDHLHEHGPFVDQPDGRRRDTRAVSIFSSFRTCITRLKRPQCAHLILPAGGWGEKEGTFINSERRIGAIKAVSRPPGEALPDFDIFKRIAEYWGCGEMFREWESPAAAFQILKRLSQGQPCDFSAITDTQAVEDQGGIQWPYAGATPPKSTERRLFEDGVFFHADGKCPLPVRGIAAADRAAE